jgi:hypothetical protein
MLRPFESGLCLAVLREADASEASALLAAIEARGARVV